MPVDRRLFLSTLGRTGAMLAAVPWLDVIGYAQVARGLIAIVIGVVILCAARMHAQQPSTGTVIGTWVGTYTCPQGLTGVNLTILEATPASAKAVFHFYADARNPRVPTGCFEMTGRYDATSTQLKLIGTNWLLRPSGYRVVTFEGLLEPNGRSFSGRVVTSGCTTFDLERRAITSAVPAKCQTTLPVQQPDILSAAAITSALGSSNNIDLNILFDFNRADIRPEGTAQLDELGRALTSAAFSKRRVGIYGHTDAVGEDVFNQKLSEARARAVQQYLERVFMVPGSRVDVRGFGESRLKRPASPADGANRRVEIVLLPN